MSWRNRAIAHRVGVWPLNGHADDVSGYGNDGTWTGTEAYVGGPFGRQVADFDGATASIEVGDVHGNGGDISVCSWLRYGQSNATGPDGIITKNNGLGPPDRGWAIYQAPTTDKLTVTIYGDSLQQVATTPAALVVGRWYHVAFTYDNSSGQLYLYVDGEYSTSDLVGIAGDWSSNRAVGLGRFSESTLRWMGRLFDTQIFNIVLTLDEINDLIRGHG